MRIHSDVLDNFDIYRAARVAGVSFVRFDNKGSRSHKRAWDIVLSGDSPYRTQADRDSFAATWDQWGVFFAYLFGQDELLMVGNKSWGYRDAADFHYRTDGRFDNQTDGLPVMPLDTHPRHKWQALGDSTQGCRTCSAVFRWRS